MTVAAIIVVMVVMPRLIYCIRHNHRLDWTLKLKDAANIAQDRPASVEKDHL